jgi:hypothetical protein
MPRAISPKERVHGWNVNFLPSTWEALRRLAFEERTTISEQVRRAVDEYLARRMKKGKK